ncbi:hypothetical protein [Variovorax sp. DXTD-1]|uniref:hypothetical protein n=1 Tax=Variovorax sp. DXTD-1 TaxID=2495592 RepID=UPI000F877A12|nr:hypothetical protein [Variovorax sp. DXTD-1]RST52508.1 hypothetical protein EJI00_06800 [Variovorax sp. DXTD-1]
MHDVKALVASASILVDVTSRFSSVVLCPLVQGFVLLPLTDSVVRDIAAARTSTEVEHPKVDDMAPGVAGLAKELSRAGPVAYISTEFFGGAGGQEAVVWDGGRVALLLSDGTDGGIAWPNSPVSRALRTIGVSAEDGKDEFDTLGLGTHRSTNAWAAAQSAE